MSVRFLTIAFVIGLVAQSLYAIPQVDFLNGASGVVSNEPGPNDIKITSATSGVYRVHALGGDIGNVEITGVDSSVELTVLIAGPQSSEIDPDGRLASGCHDFGGITSTLGDLTVQVSVSGDITGTIGQVTGPNVRIVRVDADGDIAGVILHRSPDVLSEVFGTSISGSILVSAGGRIETIRATTTITGGIGIGVLGSPASVGTITADGSLGIAGDPMELTFSGTVDTVIAPSINTFISCLEPDPVPVDQGIGRIETTAGNLEMNQSVFPRLIDVAGVESQVIRVAGDAAVTAFITDGLDDRSRIVIMGGLSAFDVGPFNQSWGFGNATVLSVRLAGSVIINGGNSGSTWTGTIAIASPLDSFEFVPLSSTEGGYECTADDLGEGTIGVVPFPINLIDSYPLPGDKFEDPDPEDPEDRGPTEANPAKFYHYGPVTWEEGVKPLVIERAIAGTLDWVEMLNTGVVEEGEDPWCVRFEVIANREHVLQAFPPSEFSPGYTYRVTPVRDESAPENGLRCSVDNVGTVAVRSYPAEYTFSVGNECPWDTNLNFIGDFDDMNVVLDNWGTTCFYPGDFNNDGNVDFMDLEIILEEWGMPCPQSQQASSGGTSPPPMASGKGTTCPIVTDMGFACHESFGGFFNSSTPATQEVLVEAMKALVDDYIENQ